MMISAEVYIQELAGKDYSELIAERRNLEKEVRDFEIKEIAGDRSGEEWMMKPSPEVIYQMNLEYLSKLCLYMRDKYNEECVWGDKTLSQA